MSDSLEHIADEEAAQRRRDAQSFDRDNAAFMESPTAWQHARKSRLPDPSDEIADPLDDSLLVDEVHRSANRRQVGGSHYGGGEIQHWDLAVMFNWNWAQYQITKYVMRYLDKNGLQDLEKAQHFLEKLIEEIKAGRMPERNK